MYKIPNSECFSYVVQNLFVLHGDVSLWLCLPYSRKLDLWSDSILVLCGYFILVECV